MKKTVSIILTCACCFSLLVGCGKKEPQPEAPYSEPDYMEGNLEDENGLRTEEGRASYQFIEEFLNKNVGEGKYKIDSFEESRLQEDKPYMRYVVTIEGTPYDVVHEPKDNQVFTNYKTGDVQFESIEYLIGFYPDDSYESVSAEIQGRYYPNANIGPILAWGTTREMLFDQLRNGTEGKRIFLTAVFRNADGDALLENLTHCDPKMFEVPLILNAVNIHDSKLVPGHTYIKDQFTVQYAIGDKEIPVMVEKRQEKLWGEDVLISYIGDDVTFTEQELTDEMTAEWRKGMAESDKILRAFHMVSNVPPYAGDPQVNYKGLVYDVRTVDHGRLYLENVNHFDHTFVSMVTTSGVSKFTGDYKYHYLLVNQDDQVGEVQHK